MTFCHAILSTSTKGNEMNNHWIVVWAEETRCAVHVTRESAIDTIKSLVDDQVSVDGIFVYESSVCRKVTIEIKDLDQ